MNFLRVVLLVIAALCLATAIGFGMVVYANAATCPYKDAYNHCVHVPSKSECEAGLSDYRGNETVGFYLKYSIACVTAYPRMFTR